MIDVRITNDAQGLSKIRIRGHAGYSSEGQDIYCAAVSAVWQCGVSCLDDEGMYEYGSEKGDSTLWIKGRPSQHDRTVLEVIVRSLYELSENFPEYVRITEETK